MLNLLKQFLYEPLTHFLLLGSLLYLYFNSIQISQMRIPNGVELSQNEKFEIQKLYKKRWNKEMTSQQFSLEKEFKLYEKILLQEAYRLELDKQDNEIKRRLLKKMELLLANKIDFIEPTEEELRHYYQLHQEEYSLVKSLSFSYLCFRDGDEKLAHTKKLIEVLNVKELEGEQRVSNKSMQEIEASFGKYFLLQLQNLKKFSWSQPLYSKKGLVLVYITEKRVGELYFFDEVQERVYGDYKEELLKKNYLQSYKKLLQNYSSK